jgi:SAM-dependent methyltransferase
MAKKYRELLIGCGSRIHKDLVLAGSDPEFKNLTTLDINKDHNPDVVHDLTKHPLPFKANTFDEAHAYEVLEHLAVQGDYKFFFKEFSEYWRILKPGGLLVATCPSRASVWAWGDPSHKRIMQKENLVYLSQAQYEAQVGKTAISDFRYIYKADFAVLFAQDNGQSFAFVLKAIKKQEK